MPLRLGSLYCAALRSITSGTSDQASVSPPLVTSAACTAPSLPPQIAIGLVRLTSRR